MENQYLEKYASAANELLQANYGDDYSVEDLEKLAVALIDLDVQNTEIDLINGLTKEAQIQAHGFAQEFYDTFEKEAATKMLGDIAAWLKTQFSNENFKKGLQSVLSKVKEYAGKASDYGKAAIKRSKK